MTGRENDFSPPEHEGHEEESKGRLKNTREYSATHACEAENSALPEGWPEAAYAAPLIAKSSCSTLCGLSVSAVNPQSSFSHDRIKTTFHHEEHEGHEGGVVKNQATIHHRDTEGAEKAQKILQA